MRLSSVFLISCAILVITGQASAEKKSMMIGKDTQLLASVIVDTILSQQSPQVVLNPSVINLAVNSEMLPEYCLLNATGVFDAGDFELKPGTLVCVAEDKRILEAVVKGRFEGLASCEDCTQFKLMSGTQLKLSLENDVLLQLQIRADGQAQ